MVLFISFVIACKSSQPATVTSGMRLNRVQTGRISEILVFIFVFVAAIVFCAYAWLLVFVLNYILCFVFVLVFALVSMFVFCLRL